MGRQRWPTDQVPIEIHSTPVSGGVTESQCATQVAALGKDLVVEEAGVHLLQLLGHHHQTFDGLLDVSEGTLQEDMQFQH